MTTEPDSRDFFISFNRADEKWAGWIAWVLEDAGYRVFYQHWDFGPGVNFVAEMQRAVIHSRQTVLVLSDSALRSDFVTAEWTAAMKADPIGAKRKLIPVRVKRVTLPLGLLGQVVYIDLVGLSQSDARSALLGGLRKRRKPSDKPEYPDYPDQPEEIVDTDLTKRLRQLREEAEKEHKEAEKKQGAGSAGAATDRQELTESLARLGVRHFNILLEGLEVPSGVVPPMPAAPRERIRAMLDWAESEASGLGPVASLAAEVKGTVTRVPLDQHVPSRLTLAAIDSCDGALDEIEALGRGYVQVRQWPEAFFTYRTLVDLAAQEDTLRYARGLGRLAEIHWWWGEESSAERSWELSHAVFGFLKSNAEAAERARRDEAEMERRKRDARGGRGGGSGGGSD